MPAGAGGARGSARGAPVRRAYPRHRRGPATAAAWRGAARRGAAPRGAARRTLSARANPPPPVRFSGTGGGGGAASRTSAWLAGVPRNFVPPVAGWPHSSGTPPPPPMLRSAPPPAGAADRADAAPRRAAAASIGPTRDLARTPGSSPLGRGGAVAVERGCLSYHVSDASNSQCPMPRRRYGGRSPQPIRVCTRNAALASVSRRARPALAACGGTARRSCRAVGSRRGCTKRVSGGEDSPQRPESRLPARP